MKNLKHGHVIIFILIIAFFYGCNNSESSSISENPDIASVIEKLPQSLFNPALLDELFLEDAVLNCIHHSTHETIYEGIEKIGTFHKEIGRDWYNLKITPKRIKVENGEAEVDFDVYYDTGSPEHLSPWTCEGTAIIVKKGSNWMIKETTIKGT